MIKEISTPLCVIKNRGGYFLKSGAVYPTDGRKNFAEEAEEADEKS